MVYLIAIVYDRYATYDHDESEEKCHTNYDTEISVASMNSGRSNFIRSISRS